MLTIKKQILLYLIYTLSLVNFSIYAQSTSARATIQPSDIKIGEQAVINLQIITPKGKNIIPPVYEGEIIPGIEVLTMLPPDTVIAHEVMTINQKYIVTSFDSTLYHIPYMPVLVGTDTLKSNGFGLKVSSPALSDTTLNYLELLNTKQTDSINFEKMGLYDIKDIMLPPFAWKDYLHYLWIILGLTLLAALIAIAVYILLNKKKKGYYFKPIVVLPPHIVAIEALNKMKSEKLWQQDGREKEFYTQLTDILRDYIEKRFMISAFEQTSDEILNSIQHITDTESSIDNLTQILKQADLVKFAKYKPLLNENDLSLINAYLFINQTKLESETELTVNKDEASETKDSLSQQKDTSIKGGQNKING